MIKMNKLKMLLRQKSDIIEKDHTNMEDFEKLIFDISEAINTFSENNLNSEETLSRKKRVILPYHFGTKKHIEDIETNGKIFEKYTQKYIFDNIYSVFSYFQPFLNWIFIVFFILYTYQNSGETVVVVIKSLTDLITKCLYLLYSTVLNGFSNLFSKFINHFLDSFLNNLSYFFSILINFFLKSDWILIFKIILRKTIIFLKMIYRILILLFGYILMIYTKLREKIKSFLNIIYQCFFDFKNSLIFFIYVLKIFLKYIKSYMPLIDSVYNKQTSCGK